MRLLLLCLLLSLTACASAPTTAEHGGGDLDQWLTQQLIPYLQQQLSRHPHFQGKSVLLVKLNEQDISPDIDAFTEQLRLRLFDSLMQTPGVNLYWRPSQQSWQHQRRLHELQCNALPGLAIFLGLDVRALPDGQFRIAVRALDRQAGQWLSGFGKSWQGRLTSAQQQQLRQVTPDPAVRGLRPSPFNADQADLNAAYLAHNMACLLQQSGLEKLSVYVAPPPVSESDYFNNLSRLLSHYLAQFQEVRISEDAQDATVSIKQDVRPIDNNGLYQYWLVPQWRDKNLLLSGAATVSYVRLTPHRQAAPAVVPAANRPAPAKQRDRVAIIHDFNLVAPAAGTSCRGLIYWDSGMRNLDNGALLPSGACFGLTLNLEQRAMVMLVRQDGQGRWYRVYPNCRQPAARWLPAWQTVRFPGGSRQLMSSYVLDQEPGTERFYVMATVSMQAASRLERYVARLPDDCGYDRFEDPDAGRQLLTWLSEQPQIEWRSVFIEHVAAREGFDALSESSNWAGSSDERYRRRNVRTSGTDDRPFFQ